MKRTEREERREYIRVSRIILALTNNCSERETSLSVADIIIASVLPSSLSPLPSQDLGVHDLELYDDEDDEDTELPFLALSWHILHIGWRDLAGKIRQAVENAFQG
jgi:hypothetical protein